MSFSDDSNNHFKCKVKGNLIFGRVRTFLQNIERVEIFLPSQNIYIFVSQITNAIFILLYCANDID